jgi:hypothetical protein
MSERDPDDKGFTVIDRRGSAGEAPSQPSAPEPDPTRPAPRVDFSMLVQSIAFSALHSLGLVTDPAGGGRTTERDLPLARHNIEILELLEEKTRGNLSPEEAKLIAGLLYEVRMHFVEATKSPGA